MKKAFLVSLAVLFAAVVFAQSSQTFSLSATVQPYVVVNPGNVSVTVAPPGAWNHVIVDPSIAGSESLSGFPTWKMRLKDNAYSNTTFTVSYTGSTGGAAYPILSRQEVNGNGYDRLQTDMVFRNEINGVYGAYLPGHERHDMRFTSGAEGASTGSYTNQTLTFANVPHDGEIQLEIFLRAALPHLSPEFGVDNTWNQSADASTTAGDYTATVEATYAAY